MPQSIRDQEVLDTIAGAQEEARKESTKTINIDGALRTFRRPFPSPIDWRDSCIYFLMLDRFNNPEDDPKHTWNHVCKDRQGGTFKGVQTRLGYLAELGMNAIWITSPLKNSKPIEWMTYHGYGAQDFLNLDARFASDGTLPTAQKELTELIDEAHARGIYVILDIVLNHSGRVFDYVRDGRTVDSFGDAASTNCRLGGEPPIEWLNGFGYPRPDWQNWLPDSNDLSPDDAVWPTELQNHLFFRRRGSVINHTPDWRGFVPGDFETMRQLVLEVNTLPPSSNPCFKISSVGLTAAALAGRIKVKKGTYHCGCERVNWDPWLGECGFSCECNDDFEARIAAFSIKGLRQPPCNAKRECPISMKATKDVEIIETPLGTIKFGHYYVESCVVWFGVP